MNESINKLDSEIDRLQWEIDRLDAEINSLYYYLYNIDLVYSDLWCLMLLLAAIVSYIVYRILKDSCLLTDIYNKVI